MKTAVRAHYGAWDDRLVLVVCPDQYTVALLAALRRCIPAAARRQFNPLPVNAVLTQHAATLENVLFEVCDLDVCPRCAAGRYCSQLAALCDTLHHDGAPRPTKRPPRQKPPRPRAPEPAPPPAPEPRRHARAAEPSTPAPPSPPPRAVVHVPRTARASATLLGVPLAASHEEMSAAYKTMVFKHHPDRGGDAQMMAAVNVAWGLLKAYCVRRGDDV